MDIVPAIADEVFPANGVGTRFFFTPEPGIVGFGAGGFSASVFVIEFERNRAKKAGSSFADIAGEEEGADVLSDAIVDVGMPALCLVFDLFPADEDVERGFSFENGGEPGLELPGRA